MEGTAILIAPRDKKERLLLEQLIHRMGLNSRSLRAAEFEDLGLSMLMMEVDRTRKAPTGRVLKKLKK